MEKRFVIESTDPQKSIKQRRRAKRMGKMMAGALALETLGSVGLAGCENLIDTCINRPVEADKNNIEGASV
jgi:hypothetical protein